MVLKRLNPEPLTVTTPCEAIATDLLDDHDPSSGAKPSFSSVPCPESTYIIRSVSSGAVIALRDGQIVLALPDVRDSIHWKCVETKGWFAFRNSASKRFLGHDDGGRLCCSAKRHQWWENFCPRMTEGGYVLLMMHGDKLWYVGIIEEQGVEKLAKIGDERSAGVVWEFIKV